MLDVPYDCEDMCSITAETVARSGLKEDVYVRPIAYKSAERVANLKLHELASDFNVIVVPFGQYIKSDPLRCCTSSWRRVEDDMIPARLKIAGLYVNSILAKTEAVLSGFDEAILLNADSHVCEGTGENLFIVVDGQICTPPLDDNVLPGITRETAMTLAGDELGIDVVERHIDRSELYAADEVFLTGTAAHITSVAEIDHRKIGGGNVGRVTRDLQTIYAGIIRGNNEKYRHWCTPVKPKA
jgi:branched-chain amino acid aminotransferase